MTVNDVAVLAVLRLVPADIIIQVIDIRYVKHRENDSVTSLHDEDARHLRMIMIVTDVVVLRQEIDAINISLHLPRLMLSRQ